MKAVFDERQRRHDPQNFMANGVISRSPEQPERIDRLADGAARAGCAFQRPRITASAPSPRSIPPNT
jgi:hypothetical protein